MKKIIRVTKSSMPEFEEYINEIKELWSSKWLTNMGVKHKKLESLLLDYLGVENIKLFTNGHLALESAIEALNLTGEVITTPFTFASTTHAIVRKGLTPIFCDINDEDYTIDVNKIEGLITERTSAIIPVHVYGNICKVSEIEAIAQKYNLKVIYDAAHAFGCKVGNFGVANFGDASMLSFHATKVFNTIEGGAVVYRDKLLSRKLDNIKNYGIECEESIIYSGGNSKMNEFQAAMGICNLRNIDKEIKKRESIVKRYTERLGNIDGIKLCKLQEGVKSNFAYLPVLFDGYALNRDEIYEELKKENIIARKYFYPITSKFECYKGMFDKQYTPVAEYISERILTLPLYADLSINDVDKICNIILKKNIITKDIR